MPSKINLNSASISELTSLPGIGQSLANRLVEYRSTVGDFRTIEELAAVTGITEVMINRFADRILVGEADGDEPDLPDLIVKVVLTPTESQGDYSNHRLTATFTRREIVPEGNDEFSSLWVKDQVGTVLPPDGDTSLTFPNQENLPGAVVFQLFAPDGEKFILQHHRIRKKPKPFVLECNLNHILSPSQPIILLLVSLPAYAAGLSTGKAKSRLPTGIWSLIESSCIPRRTPMETCLIYPPQMPLLN